MFNVAEAAKSFKHNWNIARENEMSVVETAISLAISKCEKDAHISIEFPETIKSLEELGYTVEETDSKVAFCGLKPLDRYIVSGW